MKAKDNTRRDTTDDIRNAGYDIRLNAKKLEQYYDDAIRSKAVKR